MAARRINPNLIKLHRTYTVSELAARLEVHKHTIRNWQRDGLAPIDQRRPVLFHGAIVRAFLKLRNQRRKSPCPPGTLYCFRCRGPRAPALKMVDFVEIRPGAGDLNALCETCETVMHRRVRKADLASVMPGLSIEVTKAPQRLSGCPDPSLNCALSDQGTRR